MPIFTVDVFDKPESDLTNFMIRCIEDKTKPLLLHSKAQRHTCYFLMFITEGSGQYVIDGNVYEVQPQSVFYIMPGQVHYYSFSEGTRGFSVYYTLDFFMRYFRERSFPQIPYFQRLFNQNHILPDPIGSARLLTFLECMIYEYEHNELGREEVLRNHLDIFLIYLCRYCCDTKATPTPTSHSITIQKLQHLIELHFRHLKLPKEYARLMNITPKHLNALCKRGTNKTVTDIIQERIMTEAKRLLSYSTLNVKQISFELGFSDLPYFQRFFKKCMGMTPREFREDHNNRQQHLQKINT